MVTRIQDLLHSLPAQYPGLDVLESSAVYLMGCMTFNQFCCTWRALEDPGQFCPFCPKELRRRGRIAVQHAGDWALFENEFPRKDADRMFLIVSGRHLVWTRLIDDDWRSIGTLFNYYCQIRLVDAGGALLMRFGDPRDHAGTIPHLHFNVIEPTREGGCSLPIAKHVEGPYGHKEDYARLRRFVQKVESQGGIDWLFSPEGIKETQPPLV